MFTLKMKVKSTSSHLIFSVHPRKRQNNVLALQVRSIDLLKAAKLVVLADQQYCMRPQKGRI